MSVKMKTKETPKNQCVSIKVSELLKGPGIRRARLNIKENLKFKKTKKTNRFASKGDEVGDEIGFHDRIFSRRDPGRASLSAAAGVSKETQRRPYPIEQQTRE